VFQGQGTSAQSRLSFQPLVKVGESLESSNPEPHSPGKMDRGTRVLYLELSCLWEQVGVWIREWEKVNQAG